MTEPWDRPLVGGGDGALVSVSYPTPPGARLGGACVLELHPVEDSQVPASKPGELRSPLPSEVPGEPDF